MVEVNLQRRLVELIPLEEKRKPFNPLKYTWIKYFDKSRWTERKTDECIQN